MRKPLREVITEKPVTADADEPLRAVVYRMVDSGLTRFPVIGADDYKLQGMVGLNELLRARGRNLEEERARERVLRLRMPIGRRPKQQNITVTESSDLHV